MKIAHVVESLKHLDDRAVDKLVQGLINTERFELSKTVSKFSMFLLPDGTFLNAVDIWQRQTDKKSTSINRDQMHHELYDIIRDNDTRIRMTNSTELGRPMPIYGHPSNDPDIAKYYNIIYIAAWHMAKYVIVPRGVEPTEQQHAMLRHLHKQKGYAIEIEDKNDYHLMPTHMYRDYARRKFLNESLMVLKSLNESMSTDQVETLLINHYGEADNIADTGFITPSGICLDFKRTYGVDEDDKWDPLDEEIECHTNITDVLDYKVGSICELMQDYKYIRAFGDFGIELISEPTPAQYRTIKAMASSSFKRRGKFYIDIVTAFDDFYSNKENRVFERSYGDTINDVVKFIHGYFSSTTAVESLSAHNVETKLIKTYGEATNIADTGFITPSGICLDFRRSYDYSDDGQYDPNTKELISHDDVSYVFEDDYESKEDEIYLSTLMEKYGYIRAFGNIGIQLSTEPTSKQYDVIKQLAASGLREHGEFHIDFNPNAYYLRHDMSYMVKGRLAGKAQEVIKTISDYFSSNAAVESTKPLQRKSGTKLGKSIAYMVTRK